MSFVTSGLAWWCGGMAAVYEKFNAPKERAGVAAVRARLAGDLHGRIVEIGCGTGWNFPYYSAEAEVVAIEPVAEYRTVAAERAQTVRARIDIADGDVQALPFPDDSFDGGIGTLVFCSVPDALQGLRELRRVVKPGAPVRFFEHVRSEHRAVAFAEDTVNPFWRWLLDGCNINRDTVLMIHAAGFTVDRVAGHGIPMLWGPRFRFCEVHARA